MKSRYVLLMLSVLPLGACMEDPPPPKTPAQIAADPNDYAGKGTIYDNQFKALHDAKKLGAKMNEEAGKIDEQIESMDQPSPQ